MFEDVHGELRKLFGIEARIVGDEDCGLGGFRLHVFRDGRQRQPYVCEGEIFGNDPAPARSAKLDRRRDAPSSACAHGALF